MENEVEKRESRDILDEHLLNDVWSLYFHDPNNNDWTYNSYERMCNISSIEEFWSIHNVLKTKIHSGMFFLMREYVFPCWDDENNKNGGCLSIKVLKQDLENFWEYTCIRLLGEKLLTEDHKHLWSNVNGISTSPKKHFCIVKIWLKDNTLSDSSCYQLSNKVHGEVLYRSNMESIQNNTT